MFCSLELSAGVLQLNEKAGPSGCLLTGSFLRTPQSPFCKCTVLQHKARLSSLVSFSLLSYGLF